MLNLVLSRADIRDGDIVVAEVLSGGIVNEWGESNPKLNQGWVVKGKTVTNTKSKRQVTFYYNDDCKYRVLRPTNDEPTEWGEMAL